MLLQDSQHVLPSCCLNGAHSVLLCCAAADAAAVSLYTTNALGGKHPASSCAAQFCGCWGSTASQLVGQHFLGGRRICRWIMKGMSGWGGK